MYLTVVLGFMLVLPAAAILIEALLHAGADPWLLVLRWFVFWGVGARLLVAGVRQIANPVFTAKDIFEIDDVRASKIVQELGFWNLSGGLIALLSFFYPGWALPAGVAGGLFFGLAGWQHWRNGHRNTNENIAMVSDLCLFAVLAVVVVKLLVLG